MKLYITGRNDGMKRSVYRVPKLYDHECGRAYEPVELELQPGQWVRQIVESRRIKKAGGEHDSQ